MVLGIIGLLVAGSMMYDRTYEAPFPDIHASTDSAVIARGEHLVHGTAHCVQCHFQPADSAKVMAGEPIALAGGGFPFMVPGGVFYATNISSHMENGIGGLSDGEIARALRYGVKHDGTVLIPAMEFQNLSDDDLTAIISYLRTAPPVAYSVPKNEFNLLGKCILAFILRPVGPSAAPPKGVVADTTVEYGRYVATHLSDCKGCHTERSQNTGEYIGKELAGGLVEPLKDGSGNVLVAPNLTPDPETGVLANWTFDHFKERFSQGKLIPASIMPWGQYKHLDEVELLAIWKYLHSVEPVYQDNGPAVQPAM